MLVKSRANTMLLLQRDKIHMLKVSPARSDACNPTRPVPTRHPFIRVQSRGEALLHAATADCRSCDVVVDAVHAAMLNDILQNQKRSVTVSLARLSTPHIV